jgi:hypothetical protein
MTDLLGIANPACWLSSETVQRTYPEPGRWKKARRLDGRSRQFPSPDNWSVSVIGMIKYRFAVRLAADKQDGFVFCGE